MDFSDVESRAREYEAMIRRIKDVISARVMFSPEGLIEEIHVLASGGRNAKQLVRDVESALMAQGLSIDHKKISIAQLAPEPQVRDDDRVRLLGLSVNIQGRSIEVRARLDFQGTAVEGTARGVGTADGRRRAAADATLSAITQFIKESSVVLALEDCRLMPLARGQAATVCVVELSGDGEHGLLGNCLVGGDEAEAVARATLDAVNRRFPVWNAAAQKEQPDT